uniref:EGF-like domain-containing protein n=1 Tax=Hippocampus comes TaxID=109280 RepID=A0A3Q2XWU2_HIPCM
MYLFIFLNILCSCHEGFILNGSKCQDKDECQGPISLCPEHSFCNNTAGSFICECYPGYTSFLLGCEDIDECSYNTSCRLDQVCTNVPGTYTCICPLGYHEEGRMCVDTNECEDLPYVDECVAFTNPCQPVAQCHNTPGSFVCVCVHGFVSIGPYCVDLDECQQANGQCHSAATCSNHVGGFKCTCSQGWNATKDNGHGKRGCVDFDECVSPVTCPGPSWILKITWDHVMPVSYQKINQSEVTSVIVWQNTPNHENNA